MFMSSDIVDTRGQRNLVLSVDNVFQMPVSIRADTTISYNVLLSFLLLLRFRLHFEKESKEEVERRKKIAREKILEEVSEKDLEVNVDNLYPAERGPVP